MLFYIYNQVVQGDVTTFHDFEFLIGCYVFRFDGMPVIVSLLLTVVNESTFFDGSLQGQESGISMLLLLSPLLAN